MEWQNLKFDPAKDDIEDFCNDVKKSGKQIGLSRRGTSDGNKIKHSPCAGDTSDKHYNI